MSSADRVDMDVFGMEVEVESASAGPVVDPPNPTSPAPPTPGATKSVVTTAAAGSVTVSLHPLVIMNVSEHWTRLKAQEGSPQTVVGAVIGKQKGRNIEIMNSFELVFSVIDGDIVIDREYYTLKEEQCTVMLSDESSSDSETGRFKGKSEKQDDKGERSSRNDDRFRNTRRSRFGENTDRPKDLDFRRNDRSRTERHSREKHRYSRHSPVPRRRHSRDRSSSRRRSHERHHTSADPRGRSRRSSSRDRRRYSRSRSHKSPGVKRDLKEEIIKQIVPAREKSVEKGISLSPDYKGKRSAVFKPPRVETQRKNTVSPIIVNEQEDSDKQEEVQAGSYYNMIPAVVKEKSEDSSEIDSSDDEKLRAKLLNLEKKLHKTKRKKHKKKHKKRSSRSSKDKDLETLVEVTSTTDDIPDTAKIIGNVSQPEVTSTDKISAKESSEEGEISSGDDSQIVKIDPTDLRHRLKRSLPKIERSKSPDLREKLKGDKLKSQWDICGPALPPHLKTQQKESSSTNVEGPALPPHLNKARNIGPAIPDDMRKKLAENDQGIEIESSDEDVGIGPLPVDAVEKWTDAHQRLEERALDIKIKKLDGRSINDSDIKSREEWMLELPEAKAKYLGLEARSFRAKEGPDMSDRSSWTDTPEEKARKAAGGAAPESAEAALRREARARQIASRDEAHELAIKKHKKEHKRDESLLDKHQKKLKKKKKKEDKEEKKERRPFNRDTDLQVNRFDEAQKKSVIKMAQNLDGRFSRGEAKFL